MEMTAQPLVARRQLVTAIVNHRLYLVLALPGLIYFLVFSYLPMLGILAAFKDTVCILRERLGPDLEAWTWGRVHTIEFMHPFGYLPLLGSFFNIGPFPVPGGAQMVNNMLYMAGSHTYDVVAGPSTRRLIDFANPEHSLTILPTGNSGNFMSPHYDDQAEQFVMGRYRKTLMTMSEIEQHKKHEFRFVPAQNANP